MKIKLKESKLKLFRKIAIRLYVPDSHFLSEDEKTIADPIAFRFMIGSIIKNFFRILSQYMPSQHIGEWRGRSLIQFIREQLYKIANVTKISNNADALDLDYMIE